MANELRLKIWFDIENPVTTEKCEERLRMLKTAAFTKTIEDIVAGERRAIFEFDEDGDKGAAIGYVELVDLADP